MRGIRVTPESKERDRLSFAFMANGISSERQVETAVRQTAALVRQARRAEAEGRGGGRSRGGPHRRRGRPLGADPRRLRACGAQRQRAGRARRGGGAVRHLSRRAPRRRPPGGARPPQSHARHQRHLPRRLGAAGGGMRPAALRNSLRVRAARASRSCWPAACATTARCPTPSPI